MTRDGIAVSIVIGCLLLFFATRLYQLTALPLFLDESIIIEWALEVRSGSPIGFGYHGKFLLPWIFSLLGWELSTSIWMVRVTTLLFVMLGASAIVGIGKHLESLWFSCILLLFITITPILFFFDRMALTDTILHTMLSILLLTLLRAYDRSQPSIIGSSVVGIAFVFALLAKSTAIVLLPLPLVAIIVLPAKWSLAQRMITSGITYGVMLIVWLPLQIVLTWRNLNYFGLAGQFSTGVSSSGDITTKIITSLPIIFYDALHYATLPMLILFVVMSIWLCWESRVGFVLIAMIGGFILALTLAAIPGLVTTRYWIGIVPTMMLVIIWGIYRLPYRNVWLGIVGIYMTLQFVPFINTAYFNHGDLALAPSDRVQYLEGDSSGTALPQVAQFLDEQDQRTIGAIPQCFTLTLYTESHLVECFNVGADNDRVNRFQSLIRSIDDTIYIVLEVPGYLALDDVLIFENQLVETFSRPNNQSEILIYEITP